MKRSLLCILLIFASKSIISQGAFFVAPGTSMKSEKGSVIVLDNMSLVNKGGFSQGKGEGKLILSGDLNIKVSGSKQLKLDEVVINKAPGSIVNLKTSAAIKTGVVFKSGLLNIENSVVDLGTEGALVGENEVSRGYTSGSGYFHAAVTRDSSSNVNPGNLGAIFSSIADGGTTVVRRGHSCSVKGSEASIRRFYEIYSSGKATSSLRFSYFKAELTGHEETSLSLFSRQGEGEFRDIGLTNKNTRNNFLEKSGVNPNAKWTLFSVGNSVSVFPTLAINTVHVKLSSDAEEIVHVVLYSEIGQPVINKEMKVRPGDSQLQLNVSGVVPGSYFLKVSYGQVSRTFKLVKK